MNVEGLVVVAVVISASAFFFFPRSRFQYLPGPSFRQLLPYGEVFPIFMDSSRMLTTIGVLSKRYGRTFQMWLGPYDTIVTSVPADVAQILSATQTFLRPEAMNVMFETAVPKSLMVAQKNEHLAMRKHFRQHFNFSFLADFHDEIGQAVGELCGVLTLAAQSSNGYSEPLNISEQFAITTFRVITNVAFGWTLSREERLKLAKSTDRLVDEMMLDFACYPLRRTFARFGFRDSFIESRENVNKICRKLIETRIAETECERRSRRDDLLDAIIGLQGHDLTAVTSQAIVFIVAGAHTTHETLAWSILESTRHPRVAAEIVKELDELFADKSVTESLSHHDVDRLRYVKFVWKETLRLHPPGPIFARTATEDVTLKGSGVFVPSGTIVIAHAQGSHTDPHVWADPAQFIPERWSRAESKGDRLCPGAYVPYSIGARNCAGRFLGEYEGALILAEVYRRFEFNLAHEPGQAPACLGWREYSRNTAAGAAVSAGVPVRVKLRPPSAHQNKATL